MKPVLLLLNPPGREPYLRNYFCGQTSKAGFITQPIDLIMLSGRGAGTHEPVLLDAIADGLSYAVATARATAVRPAVIVFLTSALSWQEDRAFLRGLHQALPTTKFLGIGDLFLESPHRRMREEEWLDGILFDFTNDDLDHFLRGDFGLLRRMIRREGSQARETAPDPSAADRHRLVPLPRHDLFQRPGYSFPFVRKRRHATVLTDFGCPYGCRFCVMSTLGHAMRDVDDVLAELESLTRLGIREVFFIDQSFGVGPERLKRLLTGMIDRRFGFGWVCFSRVDLVDPPTLDLMKRAGCHTIMFGVETPDDRLLALYRKGYDRKQIERTFVWCRQAGLRTVATFLLGFPEQDEAACRATIDFAIRLDPDFASFNVAFPRPGTPLRGEMHAEGLIVADRSDQAGSRVGVRTRHLSARRLRHLQRLALRRFYGRPSFLWRQVIDPAAWSDLWNRLRNGLSVLGRGFIGGM